MDDMTYLERQRYETLDTEVVVVQLKLPNHPAQMAQSFIERWGMLLCDSDGEDSAGRQKLRLMLADEVVARACQMAEIAWQEFERRGWLLTLPKPKVHKEGLPME